MKHAPLLWRENTLTLPLPTSHFFSLLWILLFSTFPLLAVQTHCFIVPSSECLELYRQNISLFDKEIAIFIQGHVQVTAYSVITVSYIYLPPLERLFSNYTLLTKKQTKMTCSGWPLSKGLLS